MSYFRLTPNGDGGWSVYELDEASLTKWLDQQARLTADGEDPPVFLDSFVDLEEIRHGDFPSIIIKGDVIVPKAVQVATRYEL